MYCSWMDWTFEIRCWPWKGWGREFLTFECVGGCSSPPVSKIPYLLRASWWEMASWESLDLLQQKTWPWPTYKRHLKGFKCIPALCEQPSRAGMDWTGKEGMWWLLMFHSVASELEKTETLFPGVPFSVSTMISCVYIPFLAPKILAVCVCLFWEEKWYR